ncbi:hypothetical protein Tmar_0719 [Thermaerobacter marianensis DSM 12885]|uniref:Uncharacterized protein n=1 Tax=Thermaerobacter marianensis (strain ATCC 700841 / DSM 12885 / JCM 10246 / 7p75a) TaxID=644966 RepID=E6SI56_THEM7|nr:hypothetical protein [Thermaerobacter marianensis]ADU50834.1 hypothetical protein Tmar_0719 [Thermaerobacter marianensis DSM 12885]
MRKVWRFILDSLKKVFLMGVPPDTPDEATVNPSQWQLFRETLLMLLGLAFVMALTVVAWLAGLGTSR